MQRYYRILAFSAATLAMTTGPLFGQTVSKSIDDDDIVYLNPFLVSTSEDKGYQSKESNTQLRFASDIKNTPYSLNVLPAAFLKDAGIINLGEAVIYAPGAVGFEKVNTPDVMIFQRGFGTLSHLVDGIATQGGFDSIGTERIEVLNGPASVLFGITNPGGTVNYSTKQPKATPFAELTQMVGSWNTFRTTVDFGAPLGSSGTIKYRIPASYTVSDGYFLNSDSRSFYAGPVISWDISSKTKAIIQLEYRDSWQIPVSYTIGIIAGISPLSWAQLSLGLPRNFNGNTSQMYMNSEQVRVSATLLHEFNSTWHLRNVTSQYHWIYGQAYSVRGATSAVSNPPFQYPRQAQIDTGSNSNFQDNLDLVGKFNVLGGQLNVDAGIQWMDGFGKSFIKSGLGVGATARPPWLLLDPTTWDYSADYLAGATTIANNSTKFRTTGYTLLGQLQTLNDRLFISGGVRYDTVTSKLNNYFNSTFQEFTSKATSGQAGILYRPKASLGFYGSYSTSFNPINRTLIDANMQSYNAVPVIGKGYEIGIKNELFGGKFSHSLALYRIQLDKNVVNLLGVSNNNTSFTYQAQGGLQESQGVEYSFNTVIGSNWAVMGGYSYNDAHIKKETNNTVGQRLVGAFRYKATAFGKYTFTNGVLNGTFVGVGGIYVSDAPGYIGALNQLCNPSFFLLNPVAGFRWQRGHYGYEAQININNALDRNYVPYSNSPPLPRNIQLTMRVNF